MLAASKLFLVLRLGLAGCCHLPPAAPPALCWRASRRLAWSDFKAKAFPRSSLFKPDEKGAISATWASMTPYTTAAGVHTYRVAAVFWPDSSWINPHAFATATAGTQALAHEQLHFDIAEVVARRLRQRVGQGLHASEDLFGTPAQQALARIQATESALGDQLDQETERAYATDSEAAVLKRWQQRLARELEGLAAYRALPTDCP